MWVTVLLLLAGLWLLLQTIVGDLPRRILSWRVSVAEGETTRSTGSIRGQEVD